MSTLPTNEAGHILDKSHTWWLTTILFFIFPYFSYRNHYLLTRSLWALDICCRILPPLFCYSNNHCFSYFLHRHCTKNTLPYNQYGFVMYKFLRPEIHNCIAMKLHVMQIVKIYEHEQTILALQISKCHSQTSSKQIKFSECLLPFKLQLFITPTHRNSQSHAWMWRYELDSTG